MKIGCLLPAVLMIGCMRAPRPQAAVAPAPPAAVDRMAPFALATDLSDDGDKPGEREKEKEDAKGAREFFLRSRLPEGETVIPIDRYLAARQHIANMPAYSIARGAMVDANSSARIVSGNNWASLGPGDFGGRTRSLVMDPNNPQTMYAGAVTGGVWKTVDGGQNWTPLTDLLPILNIGALAMDPNDSNTLYAGTGEWYQGWPGQGIFKTTDGGATWNQLPKTANGIFTYTNKLVMSPNNPGRIYAAIWEGIYTSADSGATWTAMNLNLSQVYAGCQDLAIRTDTKTDYLYASCTGNAAGAGYTIWRNPDAAGTGTWTQVYTATNMGRTSLAIAASQQTTIYAMAASYGGDPHYEDGLLAVYRSTSSGDPGSWTTQVSNADPNVMNTLLLTNSNDVVGGFCANGGVFNYGIGQGDYDNVLAVDPADPNRVWAGGIDLFRSDDGGVTWGVASLWQAPIGTPIFAHADRHVILFHPGYDGSANQTMFLGTDGGLFRTDNARAPVSTGGRAACYNNWVANNGVSWTSLNHTYVVAQFYHGTAYPGGGVYMGGAQDNSPSRGSDRGGVNGWVPFTTGDGTVVGVDPADSNIIFESTEYLSLNRALNGGTLASAITRITEKNFPFVPNMAIDPNEGKHVYLGGGTNLWRSVNSAASWSAAAPLEAGSSVGGIAVSPFDSNTVLFGTQFGYIYRSTSALTANGVTPWAYAQPRSGRVAGLAFDPVNPNVVYACYSTLKRALYPTDAHVYKSINGGVTWFPSDGSGSSSLPDISTRQIAVDPRNPQNVYVASDLGMFVSTDGGATWAHDPEAFPNVIVEDLGFDQGVSSNWLFAYSYGRGAYRVQLPNATATNCSYSVSPASISVDGFGGIVPVTVTAPPGCAWAALPGTSATQVWVQSPAQGSGNGQAQVIITPNTGFASRSAAVNIANTTVPVNQDAGNPTVAIADSSTAATPLTVPGLALIDSRNLTSSATDPVHSCTGGADYKTAWWVVTPESTGFLNVTVRGIRLDLTGNSGIVVTAYAGSAPTTELACATVPRDNQPWIDAIINFPVNAGAAYLIEVSATGATPQDGGDTVVTVARGSTPASVSIAPATLDITAGAAPQPFTATVENATNTAVRWSLAPPIGTINPAGVYTPPPSIGQVTPVMLTATSFADPTQIATATINVAPIPVGTVPSLLEAANVAGETPFIAQNTFVQLKGLNLAVNTRSWLAADFVNNQLPEQLDGVSATVNGKAAYVSYISPGQVNIISPLDSALGPVQVQVMTAGGQSQILTVQMQSVAPGFFTFDGIHLAAAHVDGSLIGPATLFPERPRQLSLAKRLCFSAMDSARRIRPWWRARWRRLGSCR